MITILIYAITDLRLRNIQWIITYAIPHVLVNGSVTVIVEEVTKLIWDCPALVASVEHTLINVLIAIVILAITNLNRHISADSAGVEHTFVRLSIAIIVETIALFIKCWQHLIGACPEAVLFLGRTVVPQLLTESHTSMTESHL